MYCHIAYAIIGIAHSAFVIFFAIEENVIVSDGEIYDPDTLKAK